MKLNDIQIESLRELKYNLDLAVSSLTLGLKYILKGQRGILNLDFLSLPDKIEFIEDIRKSLHALDSTYYNIGRMISTKECSENNDMVAGYQS